MYIYPIVLVIINSFKKDVYISRMPFKLPLDNLFVGIENYIRGIEKSGLLPAFGWSLFITVFSVAAIILFCSMTAWYISRVDTKVTKAIYMLCLFAMIVPFQMEMYTLSKIANMLKMGNPWGIIVIYLGFGAGLSIFMFTGFMKSIPLEIEEAAMIDGCTPVQTFFRVVMPISKPTCVTVTILQAMWIWNDYLLPSLVLDQRKYKTYGSSDGDARDRHRSDRGLLSFLPEIYHRRRGRRRGERIKQRVFLEAESPLCYTGKVYGRMVTNADDSDSG